MFIYDVDDNIIIDNDDDDITVASVVGLLLPIALRALFQYKDVILPV